MQESQPWLAGIDDAGARALLEELCQFLFRPAFGAQSKREIELRVFDLLYGERLAAGSVTIGDLAEQLGVPRTRARRLVLDSRSRRMATATSTDREKLLRQAVLKWPANGLEADDQGFKVLVEDPFVRDVLKTYAYRRGIVLDGSFSSDLVTLKWASYEDLLRHLTELQDDDLGIFAAEIRLRLSGDERQLKKFDSELQRIRKANRTPAEKRADFVITAKKWAAIAARFAPGLPG